MAHDAEAHRCGPVADDAAEVAACFDVMLQLRPQLERQAWPAQVARLRAEGYRLACARAGDGAVVAVAGYRMHETLHAGRMLYVDDLVTDAARRSSGAGRALFAWLVAEARRLGCEQLHLDSGVQRFDAHRFYLRERMHISSHHFALRL